MPAVAIKEIHHPFVGLLFVVEFHQAVNPVVVDMVFHFASQLLQLVHQLIDLPSGHAEIVLALMDLQRCANRVEVVVGGAQPVLPRIFSRVEAHLQDQVAVGVAGQVFQEGGEFTDAGEFNGCGGRGMRELMCLTAVQVDGEDIVYITVVADRIECLVVGREREAIQRAELKEFAKRPFG